MGSKMEFACVMPLARNLNVSTWKWRTVGCKVSLVEVRWIDMAPVPARSGLAAGNAEAAECLPDGPQAIY